VVRSVRQRPSIEAVPWKLVLALATVWIVWGSTFLGIKVMVETIPPLVGSGLRFLTGGLVLTLIVLRTQGRQAFHLTAEQCRGSAALGLLLVAGGVGLVAIAEHHHLPSSLAALIASSEAAMVLGLRVVAGRERISPATAFGVGVGVVGVVLLLLPGSRPAGIPIWAALLALGGSVTWAAGTYAGARLTVAPNLLVGVSVQMLTGGLVLAGVGFVTGESLDPAGVSAASAVALVGLTAASVGVYIAYGWLLRHASLSLVTTQCYVNPLVAVALGVLVLGESLSAMTAVGMAVTLVAVALVLRAERRPSAPEPAVTGRATDAGRTTGSIPVVQQTTGSIPVQRATTS
jgi:drug/metabolite transporter (DMT)-like permease